MNFLECLGKMKAVYDSCETPEQVSFANNYCERLASKFDETGCLSLCCLTMLRQARSRTEG